MQKKEERNRRESGETRAQVTTLQASEEPQQPNAVGANLQPNSDTPQFAANAMLDLEQPIDASYLQTLRPANLPVVAASSDGRLPPNTANAAGGAAAPAGSHPSLSDIAAIAELQKRLIRLCWSLPEDSTAVDPHSPGDWDIDDVNPIPSRVKRDWHRDVSPALRKRFIKELFHTLISTTELPSALAMHAFYSHMMFFAQKMENLFFKESATKARYIYLLAEKLHTFQLEFAGKQQKRKIQMAKIGQLLHTGMVTVPAGTVFTPGARPQTREQRQPDSRPHQQPPRQTANLRLNTIQPPQRRRQHAGFQATPTQNPPGTITMPVDVVLEQRHQQVLQDWYAKEERLLLFERQQIEQTVPNSWEYYDDDYFSAMWV